MFARDAAQCKSLTTQTRIDCEELLMNCDNNDVRFGSLVEVLPGPLRVSEDAHNLGIVTDMPEILGTTYAGVITNTGKHRLIMPEHLQVLSQMLEEER